MKLLHGLDDLTGCRGGMVSIGNFDGVHRGHQAMIAALIEQARTAGVAAVAFTFDPHPITLLRPDAAPPRLSTVAWKAELLARYGVDCAIAYPTDWNLLNLTPREFFEQIIVEKLAARGLVEGRNFFFGKNRAGDVDTLRSLCGRAGLSLTVVEPVTVGGRVVSSSRIRQLIGAGEVSKAVELLGHPYRLRGTVVRGAERGRTIGVPTANVEGIETLLPADGVYAGLVSQNEQQFPAAINVGPNPTFGEDRQKVEAHLLDFTGDLYGQPIELDLIDRIRSVRTFAGVEELKAQLQRDFESVRAVAKRSG
ncbi:MAG: bifunctional riboflavin kinase/FAD synthetase [Planctomycetaceae bacterium]